VDALRRFDDAIFGRSAAAFDNPDIVILSYRHRFFESPTLLKRLARNDFSQASATL
jgi:hypothetical protein